MKKLKLLILMLPLLGVGQTNFCTPGATWHIESRWPGNYLVNNGYSVYKYTQDTVIKTKNCKKITGTYYGDLSYFETNTVVPNYRKYYAYEENDVLLCYNGRRFDTVVNFNANIGDKWLWPQPRFDSTHYRNPLHVIDTSSSIINNIRLKTVKVAYTYTSQPTFTFTEKYVQRISPYGSPFSSPPALFPEYIDLVGLRVNVHLPTIRFRCYEDNLFPTYNPDGKGCAYVVGLNENPPDELILEMKPNPTSHKITLRLNNNWPSFSHTEAWITDISGKHLYSQNIVDSETEVDVERFESGMYFFVIKKNRETVLTSKFIKN